MKRKVLLIGLFLLFILLTILIIAYKNILFNNKEEKNIQLTNKEEIIPLKSETIYIDNSLNGALPEIDDNMIPVYYENNTWKKADIEEKWYSYEELNWANVVVVKAEKQSEYKELASHSEILMDDVLGFFVWIPRFEYKLFNVNNEPITEQMIDINIVNNNTEKNL